MVINFFMKQVKSVVIVVLVLLCFETGSAVAQLGALFNIGGHGALYAAGSGRMSKQEKLIEQSSKDEKINGSRVTVLRVTESAIKSKAKKNIIALQKRLDEYAALYKNNQPIDIPKNDSDLIAIQDKDENWPAENYVGEIRAYKRYALQLKQKMAAALPVSGGGDSLKGKQ